MERSRYSVQGAWYFSSHMHLDRNSLWVDITDSYQVCTHLSQSDGIEKKMQPVPSCKMPVFPILGAENCYAIIYLIKCDWVPFILDTTHFTASLEQQLPEFRHPKNEMISRHQDIFTEEQLHACVRLLKLTSKCFLILSPKETSWQVKEQKGEPETTSLFLHLPSLSTTVGTKSKWRTAVLRDLDRLEEGNNRNLLKFSKVLPVGRKRPCQPHRQRTSRPLHCSHLVHSRGSCSTTHAEGAAQHKS